MHMTRRCLGVMWTSDGRQWDRRLIAVPDENDAPGAQFYYNTLYPGKQANTGRPAMSLEKHWNNALIDAPGSTVGTLSIYDAKANQIWPELVCVEDLLHWRRFAERRKPGARKAGR